MSKKRKRQRNGNSEFQPLKKTTTRRAKRQRVNTPKRNALPWLLPGIVAIAVIAVALVGFSVLGSDDAQDDAAAAADIPSPSLGDPSAEVVIHEYGDYQCPFCGRFARSVKPGLEERFIDRGVVRLVWHDLAFHGHESRTAANAARCAGEQGRFWEFHDFLFQIQAGENDGTFSSERLKGYGDAMDLEREPFHTCVDEGRYDAAIDADMRAARRLSINGTPTFTIGDQRVVGAQPLEVFEQAVLRELQANG